jgi:hypothetical protein
MSASTQAKEIGPRRIGLAALSGWRGRAVRPLAAPIAKRSRFSREQVEAFFGFLLLAYAVYRILSPVVRSARERR